MRTKRKTGKRVALFSTCAALALLMAGAAFSPVSRPVLRISDWETGEVYIARPVSPGDELCFGWIHSLEKIPWDEFYHIDEDLNLILDTIRFPAFGAGIPHDKGAVCYVKDGFIYMSEINEKFTEFVWMNSPTATREIRVAGEYVARGSELPHNRRLVLNIKKRHFYERQA